MTDKQRLNSSLADALRAAIAADKRSLRDLATEAGLSNHSQLSHFMRGARDLTLDSADRLASVLGVRITPPRPKPDRPAK